jgi:hypothetical protein
MQNSGLSLLTGFMNDLETVQVADGGLSDVFTGSTVLTSRWPGPWSHRFMSHSRTPLDPTAVHIPTDLGEDAQESNPLLLAHVQ